MTVLNLGGMSYCSRIETVGIGFLSGTIGSWCGFAGIGRSEITGFCSALIPNAAVHSGDGGTFCMGSRFAKNHTSSTTKRGASTQDNDFRIRVIFIE